MLLGCLLATHDASATSFTQLFRHAVEQPALAPLDAAPDGSIVAGGALGNDAWLVRCFADGDVAWQRWFRVGTSERLRIVDVAAVPSGRTLALAERWHVVGVVSIVESILVRVGPAGDLQGAVQVEGTPLAVDVLPDGSALVLSRRTGNLVTCLTLHDATGGVVWTKDLVGMATSQATGDVRVLANGTFAIAVGGSWAPPGTSAWIGVAEAGAVLRWEGAVPGPVAARVALAPMPDGGVLLMTGTDSPGAPATLQRFATDGTSSWRRAVTLGRTSAPIAIAAGPDGSTAVLATSQQDGAVVARLDATGRSQWLRSIGVNRFGLEPMVGGGTLALADGIVLAGTFSQFGAGTPRTPAIVRIDLAGNVDGCLSGASLPDGAIDLPVTLQPVGAAFAPAPTPPSAPLSVSFAGGPASQICTLACAADAQEPDDDCASAASRGAAPLQLVGNFCNDVDDWLRIETCAQETLTIETNLLGASADTIVEAWSADCSTLLASDDDSAGGRASRIRLPGNGGAMKVRVRQADGSSGPERGYTLSVTAQRPMERTFATRLGSADETAPTVAVPRAGGGFVIGGARGRDAWALATDATGSVRWTSAWESPGGPELVLAVAPAADGGALLVTGGGLRGGNLLFRRIDATGARLWHFEMPKVGFVSLLGFSAAQAPDGGFVVAGSVVEGMTLERAWVLRVAPGGSIDWQRTLEVGLWATPCSLVALPDGGAFVASTSYVDAERPVAHVLRLDAGGDVAWSRELEVDGCTLTTAHVVATPGGGAAVGCTAMTQAGKVAIELLAFDAAGGVSWRRAFDLLGGATVGALAVAADGGLVVGAGSPSTEGVNRAAILRLDELGRVAWCRSLRGLAWSSDTLGVQEQPDGDVLVAASLLDPPVDARRPPVGLVRLDSGGRLGGACRSVSALVATTRAPRLAVTDAGVTIAAGIGTVVPSSSMLRDLFVDVADACPCACAPTAMPSEVSPPGEPEPLVFTAPDRLTWERPEASGSCRFNLYRGDVAQLRLGDYGACLASDLTLNEAVDMDLPGPSRAFAYLVTGEADFEGTAGNDSMGRRRGIAAPCP